MTDPKRIVIIDDMEPIRRTFEMLLKASGFTVSAFSSGTQALQNADVLISSDCVILDFQLPDMDGLELCKQLRQKSIDIPVVIVSGSISDQNAQKLHTAGVEKILFKPVSGMELIKQIKSIVGTAQESVTSSEDHSKP